jgi:hypothetical protein
VTASELGVLELIAKIGWGGGIHYGVDLVNDTAEPLDLFVCEDDGCDSLTNEKHLGPGESRRTVGDDEPYWWLAKNEAGDVLGCFRIDFEPADHGIDLFASQLQPCP